MKKPHFILLIVVLVFGFVATTALSANPGNGNGGGRPAGSGAMLESIDGGMSISAIRCIIDCELDGEREGSVIVDDEDECLEVCEIVCDEECMIVQ